MMFMVPSDTMYGGPDYQLAKGKVDPDDATTEDAAIREACEELGLFKSNIEYVTEVGTYLGRTDVFIAKIHNKQAFGVPDFETGATAWMTPEEFEATGRPLHRPLVRDCVELIKELEGL